MRENLNIIACIQLGELEQCPFRDITYVPQMLLKIGLALWVSLLNVPLQVADPLLQLLAELYPVPFGLTEPKASTRPSRPCHSTGHYAILGELSSKRCQFFSSGQHTIRQITFKYSVILFSMLAKEKQEVGMNLPVGSHIDRLAEMIVTMRGETEVIEKELQILRGNITQLSYINKESDKELNAFLIDSIAALRNKWSAEWDQSSEELAEHKKKLAKVGEEHQDIEISREELQEKVMGLETAVGLRIYE